MPALFFAFEGPEGAGKTTQVDRLINRLRLRGIPALRTREPGGTPVGSEVRRLLVAPDGPPLSGKEEALLLAFDRLRHVEEVIRPALARGEVVITDRYADSTLAHQGFGSGAPLADLEWLIAYATGGLAPDITILLDVDVAVGIERRHEAYEVGLGEFNRIDARTLDYHRRVREGYLTLARRAPARYLVLDAGAPEAEVEERIWRHLAPLIGVE
ncbi:MAG TPA: dTMP kinase [Chloroflexota bacterium]|nr:dTMP kinase [Chloroflexota bacterium]